MPTRLLSSTTLLFRDAERLVDRVIEPFSLRVAGYVRRRNPHIKQVSRAPIPQAGAVQRIVPLGPTWTWPAARAQLDEQLRPAFSNLIVEYCSPEGSISARNLPNEDFAGSQTFNAPGALDEF